MESPRACASFLEDPERGPQMVASEIGSPKLDPYLYYDPYPRF